MTISILTQTRDFSIQQNLIPHNWQDYADIPFVIPAMCFPWEIFKPVERDYYTLLYLHLKNGRAHDHSDEIQPALFSIPEEEEKFASSLFRPSPAGRKPHPFMPFFRAFELASLQYIEVMVESVYLQVKSNPLFATMCGFTEKIPSYRSFARFDQIMTTNGLWEKARLLVVEYNKGEGVVETNEEAAAVDTSHIEAEATLNKTRKTCSCEGDCDCPKVLTDDNVGVMRKSNAVSYIAHKLSMVCGVRSGLPLTREVFKGNTPDGKTLEPTLETFKAEHPEMAEQLSFILADGIYQTPENQKVTKDVLQAKLVAPINPRNRKDKPTTARGIEKINRYGTPICISGHKMELRGSDREKGQYIYTCPVFHPNAKQEGLTCPLANHAECCNGAAQGRVFRIDFDQTPQVDVELPQHGRTFEVLYSARTIIERIFGILKDGYSLRRVHKRGKQAVEAHVDRCMISMHIMANMAYHQTGKANCGWTRNRLQRAN
ncbi:transposase [Heyndrickxia coagulans]|uniref:transposase n=1 Tax=Heyndrickxia coagulans TaxID=1398 RepID=UPI001EEED38C|nr:transposase [Heyndrickxia coagulans]UJZ86678.1 transposase [Heyndrickxia coagulans]UJZ87119.1 transposase [Heyndrickxia coagulans]UJZ87249.1 transposase [Heyndrickxia coagulans]UJZ87268.1 transposase [Heyndrickxia coagulans]UJZ87403.1 transposase [Heyndrickxia coagulans]